MTDHELIENFVASGDDLFFNQLYKKHESEAYSRCFRYLANEKDVEDTFQNIWVIVYFHLKDFKFKAAFTSWLYRIITNQCLNFLKQQKQLYSIDTIDEDIINLERLEDNYLDHIINRDDVAKFLSRLSKEETLLLKLKYLDEYNYKTIAKITGLSEGSLRMRITRIKQKLMEGEQ